MAHTGETDLFHHVSYERGALTFHALHTALGDDAFWAVMTAFFEEFAATSASTDDFVDTVERVTGRQHDDLFTAWLGQPALPPPS